MTHYLDTSALVKFYVDEVGSNVVREIFNSNSDLSTSRLALVEATCAFARPGTVL